MQSPSYLPRWAAADVYRAALVRIQPVVSDAETGRGFHACSAFADGKVH